MLLKETLQQVSPKDKPWETHKTENVEVGHLYGLEPRFARYAQRMAGCGDYLEFAEVATEHDKRLKLTRASFCRVRHCPICTWRKSLARIARFMANLPAYLESCPDYAYLLVTLTTRNCDFDAIRATIKNQNDGVKKLLKRKELKMVKGYIRVNEITKGQDGLAHPHIHLILAVNKSYFTSRDYVPQKRWAQLWGACLGLDYEPRVDVRRVKMSERKKAKLRAEEGREPTPADDLISGLLEVSKYAVKPAETAEDAEYLYAVTEQCHHMRFLATGGCLKDIYRDGARDAEEISDEEMLRPGGEDDQDKASPWRQLYLWARERRAYRLALRRKAAPDPLVDDLEFCEGLTEAMRQRAEERRRVKKPPEASPETAFQGHFGARTSRRKREDSTRAPGPP